MSRGHHAIKLLADVVIALDSSPSARVVILAHPEIAAFANRARLLVREATNAVTAPNGNAPVPNYCTLCQAQHPRTDEPEPHGARRSAT